MKNRNEKSESIRNFILECVSKNEKVITKITAEKFGISKQAISRYIKKLVNDGFVEESGSKRGKSYKLKSLVKETFSFKITPNLEEHVIWREHLDKLIRNFPRNIYDICSYGVSEMLNNAIEHSEGNNLIANIVIDAVNIEIMVIDDGIGIFNKIQRDFGIDHPRYAILELCKGKLTSDDKKHSGQGIFFTSRIFDYFIIISEKLMFSHTEKGNDWSIEDVENAKKGTVIGMRIAKNSNRIPEDVFNKYSSTNDLGFDKTIVPVTLLQFGTENLVSRSQARRLLVRFDKFKEIVLDFKGVNIVGNAFIYEIFRVFKTEHPEINIHAINAGDNTNKIIKGISLIELDMDI